MDNTVFTVFIVNRIFFSVGRSACSQSTPRSSIYPVSDLAVKSNFCTTRATSSALWSSLSKSLKNTEVGLSNVLQVLDRIGFLDDIALLLCTSVATITMSTFTLELTDANCICTHTTIQAGVRVTIVVRFSTSRAAVSGTGTVTRIATGRVRTRAAVFTRDISFATSQRKECIRMRFTSKDSLVASHRYDIIGLVVCA